MLQDKNFHQWKMLFKEFLNFNSVMLVCACVGMWMCMLVSENVRPLDLLSISTGSCQKIDFLFFCIWVFTYMYAWVPRISLVHAQLRRVCCIHWNWSYRLLWTTMHVLGTEPQSSEIEARALNHWDISPGPGDWTFKMFF